MSASEPAPVSYRVADRVRAAGPWEVFGERARRFEVHFNGRTVESVRGPLAVEGYNIRVFQVRGDRTGPGAQASTDSSEAGIARTLEAATKLAAHSDFPAKQVELPSRGSPNGVEIVDRKLWADPLPHLQGYLDALLAPFDAVSDAVPSFGSVRATLSETSLANSAGLRVSYAHTSVDLELAIKAFGGPEGAPPGEYWVTESARRVEPERAAARVPAWCQYARDARRARAPPTGEIPVVLPPNALAGILPNVLGFRCTGSARLRELAPEPGTKVAAEGVTVQDDGRFAWASNTAPVDDEGVATARRTLVAAGAVSGLLYDVLHGGAFGMPSSGNGLRGLSWGPRDWLRFLHSPGPGASTLVVEPGDGGRDEELVEAAGDGIWLQQLGWASPDPISGAFGGEVRIAYRIRNGKLAEPLRGGTIGGTVMAPPGSPSLLASIAAIGSRPTLVDFLSSPTVLVRNLTVAGE
jgi:predicted Zn-dependent protease